MMTLHEWHPMLVHFPLALVVTATLALSAARRVRDARRAAVLGIVGTWNLALGAVGVLLALASGLAAVVDVSLAGAARQAVAAHVRWAVLAGVLTLLLAVWRAAGQRPEDRPGRLLLVLLWAMTAALVVAGYRGEQNVYRYGVGVAGERTSGDPERSPH